MTYETKGETANYGTYWHYRTNDVTEDNIQRIMNLQNNPNNRIDWIVISNPHEGECLKGIHIHVAIKFKISERKSKARNVIIDKGESNYYLEPKYKNSTIEQFMSYIIKTGIHWSNMTIETFENMEPKKKEENKKINTNELYKDRIKRAKAQDWEWFEENDTKWSLSAEYQKLYAKYNQSKNIVTSLKGSDIKNYWIWGKSGTGKSSSIQYLYPDRYMKLLDNKTWDGFSNDNKGHEIVHIDELNSFNDIKEGLRGLAGLKCMADVNPFNVRKNYGNETISIRPKSFIITSNYNPSQLLTNLNKYDNVVNLEIELEALRRKFNILHISEWLQLKGLICIPKRGIFKKSSVEKQRLKCENKNKAMKLEQALMSSEDVSM